MDNASGACNQWRMLNRIPSQAECIMRCFDLHAPIDTNRGADLHKLKRETCRREGN